MHLDFQSTTLMAWLCKPIMPMFGDLLVRFYRTKKNFLKLFLINSDFSPFLFSDEYERGIPVQMNLQCMNLTDRFTFRPENVTKQIQLQT